MSLYSLESLPMSPAPNETLALLAKAAGDARVPSAHRVAASANGRTPDEGLALLAAYVAIEDKGVRQAVLDLLLGIAGINPHH